MCKRLVAPTLLENQILVTPVRRKEMQTIKFPHGLEIAMRVASDCVVFEGTCLCHNIDTKVTFLATQAKVAGKDKIVLIGDCSDHDYRHDDLFPKAVADNGIQGIWLDPGEGYAGRDFVKCINPAFDLAEQIQSFADAEMLALILPHLIEAGRRYAEVLGRIEWEKKTLNEYPIACSVEGLEYHPNTMRNSQLCKLDLGAGAYDLFGSQMYRDTNKVDANMTACFKADLSSGMLITKSMEIPFTIDKEQGIDREQLKSGYSYKRGGGSLRIMLHDANQHLSLYVKQVRRVEEHPVLDPKEPNPHFTPMWQRLRNN